MKMSIPVSVTNSKKLLVLVITPGRQDFEDFHEIAKVIAKQASDILIHIVTPLDTCDVVPAYKWRLPTITVSLSQLGKFFPPRGRILENRQVKKLDQYARFKACGIDTPYTDRFEFGQHYDEKTYGEFCVLKPLKLDQTSLGQAQLYRTARLAGLKENQFASGHFMKSGSVLVQQFIDTGKNPSYYRVLSLFEAPLYWARVFFPDERPDLSADDSIIEATIINPNDLSVWDKFAMSEMWEAQVDPSVVDFSSRIHAAFPNIPILGCDILKEEKTGRLYAIEINAGGNVWHFSSKIGRKWRDELGGRKAMIASYDPWLRAADALIKKTREFAS